MKAQPVTSMDVANWIQTALSSEAKVSQPAEWGVCGNIDMTVKLPDGRRIVVRLIEQ